MSLSVSVWGRVWGRGRRVERKKSVCSSVPGVQVSCGGGGGMCVYTHMGRRAIKSVWESGEWVGTAEVDRSSGEVMQRRVRL